MQTIDQLNASFAIPGLLEFDQHNELIRANINTPACRAELYLQGAHVTAWQPRGAEPVLFVSEKSAFEPGKPIRGGIPIIFPWFGSRTATPGIEEEDSRTDGPSHGFARTQVWKLDFGAYAAEELHLSLSLDATDLSRSLGYDRFLLAYQITFGRELRLRLSIANDGEKPMRVEEALHTYLHVGEVEQTRVHGLFETVYLDKTDDFARKTQTQPVLMLSGATDRPYLNTTSPIAVDDPVLHRRITATKANSNTTVIWNPWADNGLADMSEEGWRQMLCVESANAADNALHLQPRAAHVMETTISVEALA
ncbi:MAG TPA: D-hexose-6-phosphate mutarotase [Acidobacteriaceae bacterium]|nr:D-hexose-6-phosphate mutarotase [Acidobacteriaceae bacterium]